MINLLITKIILEHKESYVNLGNQLICFNTSGTASALSCYEK